MGSRTRAIYLVNPHNPSETGNDTETFTTSRDARSPGIGRGNGQPARSGLYRDDTGEEWNSLFFVPDEPTQEMRNFLRTRKQFARERSSHVHRIQKTLEDANIKLDSVITDIMGLSGRRMIEALIAGETDPFALAVLAHRGIRALQAELEAALRGRLTDHHRFMLQLLLQHIDAIDAAVGQIDQEVDARVEPFRIAIEILNSIPGGSDLSAEIIVAESHRHEPLPDRRSFDLMSRPVSQERRKPYGSSPWAEGPRQASIHPHAEGRPPAENHPHPRAAARTKGSYLQAQFQCLRVVPTDPLIYRFYELVQVYARPGRS